MARNILICLTRQEDKVYTRASQFEFERAKSHSKTSIHEREMSLFGLLTSGICLGIQETTHESVCVCLCVSACVKNSTVWNGLASCTAL